VPDDRGFHIGMINLRLIVWDGSPSLMECLMDGAIIRRWISQLTSMTQKQQQQTS
jgi:hypothetical protein